MSNIPKPTEKISGTDYSNQSKQGKNTNRNPTQQNDDNKSSGAGDLGGMKNDPQSIDPRREREEEDRPRADSKYGNK